jgi:hypothetical protein
MISQNVTCTRKLGAQRSTKAEMLYVPMRDSSLRCACGPLGLSGGEQDFSSPVRHAQARGVNVPVVA